ncbi:methylenetetrahydrofolate reductase [Leptolyngbya sp. FACHB-261]|uniref:methylenetetrahydrofolate reductase n=1 Tax=Leptolyngbya sp. FACHB-261 TaxID=2692806 RepID=UPI001689B30C|nr:methylenetetrahydrofolate reductase [Leptolyngbya sp. FACHB-261]MBD2102038.1 methylenetetrahydrofolate reductase [Leptolyngbya sp. FACHB-261]
MTAPIPRRSALAQAAARGEFLITAEVAPPCGSDPSLMLSHARLLKDRVHAVNITDCSRAVLRMSALVSSALLLREGIEPVCQLACRDRNRLALMADLMGASALGVWNVLALTGDPVKAGNHPEAKSVFDLESVRLLQLISKLNAGLDCRDQPLCDGPTELFAGAAVDPQSGSWSGLQRRFERKLAAGAQFFQSQMITDFDRLSKFMDQVGNPSGKPVLAGIFLLKSAKNAQFVNRCVPGVNIPDSIIERLAQAPDPLAEGVQIAAEQVRAARDLCQGVHLMAVKKENLIPQILDLAGIAPLFKIQN